MLKDRGFLLIEVMVTIAVLSFGLACLSRAFVSCLNAMAQVSYYTVASNLAEERIFALKMSPGEKSKAAQNDTSSEYPDFNFEVETEKIKELPLNDIKVTVNWKHGRRTGSFDVRSYLPVTQ